MPSNYSGYQVNFQAPVKSIYGDYGIIVYLGGFIFEITLFAAVILLLKKCASIRLPNTFLFLLGFYAIFVNSSLTWVADFASAMRIYFNFSQPVIRIIVYAFMIAIYFVWVVFLRRFMGDLRHVLKKPKRKQKKLITSRTPFLGIIVRSFGCRILVIALLWSLLHEVLHAVVLVANGERVAFGLVSMTTAVACLSCNPSVTLFPVVITPYIFDLAFVVAGIAASSRTLYWLSNIAFFDIMSNLFGFLIGRLPNDFDVMTKASPVAASLIILISLPAWLYIDRHNLKNWRPLKKKYF